jgi:hypothetical protein
MKKKGSDALARPSSSRLPREELGHAKLSLVRPQLLEPRALWEKWLVQLGSEMYALYVKCTVQLYGKNVRAL